MFSLFRPLSIFLFVAVLTSTVATLDTDYPYTVAIYQPALADRSSTTFICSGIQIGSTSVLTIAECITGLDAADLMIRTGVTSSAFQNFTVSAITVHPQYNSTTLDNDVAIIHLASSSNNNSNNSSSFNSTYCPVASLRHGLELMTDVTLVSWGSPSNATQTISTAPKSASVAVVDSATCAEKLSGCFDLASAQHFCTNATVQGQAYGDGGGAAVDNVGMIVGLISGNPACAQPNGVALQVNINHFYSWIMENIR